MTVTLETLDKRVREQHRELKDKINTLQGRLQEAEQQWYKSLKEAAALTNFTAILLRETIKEINHGDLPYELLDRALSQFRSGLSEAGGNLPPYTVLHWLQTMSSAFEKEHQLPLKAVFLCPPCPRCDPEFQPCTEESDDDADEAHV